jgi:Xaa-Pro aminopeptidase
MVPSLGDPDRALCGRQAIASSTRLPDAGATFPHRDETKRPLELSTDMTTAHSRLAPRLGAPPPRIPDRLIPLLEAEAPRFSAAEMQRRRSALADALAEAGASHALIVGTDRRMSALQWLTGYPSSNLNMGVFSPGEPDVLFVPYPNHVPQAQVLAADAKVVWGAKGPAALALETLSSRGAKSQGIGIIGQVNYSLVQQLAVAGFKLIDLNRAYNAMRLIKSEEEFDWARIGCAFSDLAIEALGNDIAPGMSEHELAAIIERAYLPWGGVTHIHFVGLTSMTDPDCCVPSQFPRARRVAPGDVVFSEISALFWGYSGQVLRTYAVAAEPTPLYRDLHAVAEETFQSVLKVLKPGATPKDILDAASVIGKSGFAICDDLLHGFIGGYLPPVLGTHERPSGPVPDLALQENMAVVLQPSIVTKDGKAGVQTGELLRITRDGVERLHQARSGFHRVGG